jgi:hypothetical protein
MAYIKNVGGSGAGQGGAPGMFQVPGNTPFRSPSPSPASTEILSGESEIGAANIVTPKGSVRKVGGVTQVRRGSGRERAIAQNARMSNLEQAKQDLSSKMQKNRNVSSKTEHEQVLRTAQPGSNAWLNAWSARYPGR